MGDPVMPFELEAYKPGRIGVEQPNTARFTLLSPSEIDELPDLKWLVHGMIARDSLVGAYGKPDSGKTFLFLDLALSIAAGLPDFHGIPILSGPVVYSFAEGRGALKHRRDAWLKAHPQADRDQLEANFRAVLTPCQLTQPGQVEELADAIRSAGYVGERSPVTCVIDTLSKHIPGVSDSGSEILSEVCHVCDCLRREFHGMTPILVHHPGWRNNQERGSSVLRGGVRTMIEVVPQGDLKLRVSCQKMNDAPKFAPLSFEIVPVVVGGSDNDAITSCFVRPAPCPVADAVVEREAEVVRLLSGRPGMTQRELGEDLGIGKSTVNDILKSMERRGLLRKIGQKYEPVGPV